MAPKKNQHISYSVSCLSWPSVTKGTIRIRSKYCGALEFASEFFHGFFAYDFDGEEEPSSGILA